MCEYSQIGQQYGLSIHMFVSLYNFWFAGVYLKILDAFSLSRKLYLYDKFSPSALSGF